MTKNTGWAPQIQPPDTPQFYPSLPWWLANRRQKRKMLGEEMRLLYVAVTRAAQRLILAGTTGKNSVERKWPLRAERGPSAADTLSCRNYLDWIGAWLLRTTDPAALAASGHHALLSWTIYDEHDARLGQAAVAEIPAVLPAGQDLAPELRDRLLWQYPFQVETKQRAKTSVTAIRRQIADADGDESYPLFGASPARGESRSVAGLSAAEIGSAHHAFLQLVSLDKVQNLVALKAEAARIARQNLLSGEEMASLDFEALAAFWQSEVGRQLLGQSARLERELAFTARFSAADLRQLGCAAFPEAGPTEFVVVQGVMDLVAILPREIWLLDFKTDHFPSTELEQKISAYRPQLALYSQALERIHRRPVTKRWLHFLALRQTVRL